MNNVQDIDFSTGLLFNFCRKIESTKETFKIYLFYKVEEIVAITFLGYFFKNSLEYFQKFWYIFQNTWDCIGLAAMLQII